jgi:hypothetical protein
MAAPKGHVAYEGCGRPKEYTKDIVDELAMHLEEWIEEKDNLFIQKFAYEMRFNHRKVSEFKDISPKFREACDRLDAKQQFSIFEGGLKRKYAHPMCALILSSNHNINLKTEQKLSGSTTDPVEFLLSKADGNTKDLVEDE